MLTKTPTIQGFSRQAMYAGLPVPYWFAVTILAVYPFYVGISLFPDSTFFLVWPLSGVLWYAIARIIVAINPRAHFVAWVVLRKTTPKIFDRNSGRRYVR